MLDLLIFTEIRPWQCLDPAMSSLDLYLYLPDMREGVGWGGNCKHGMVGNYGHVLHY